MLVACENTRQQREPQAGEVAGSWPRSGGSSFHDERVNGVRSPVEIRCFRNNHRPGCIRHNRNIWQVGHIPRAWHMTTGSTSDAPDQHISPLSPRKLGRARGRGAGFQPARRDGSPSFQFLFLPTFLRRTSLAQSRLSGGGLSHDLASAVPLLTVAAPFFNSGYASSATAPQPSRHALRTAACQRLTGSSASSAGATSRASNPGAMRS